MISSRMAGTTVPMPPTSTLAERIQRILDERSLSPGKLAKAAGLSRAAVDHLKSGKRGGHTEAATLDAIAKAANVARTWCW